MRTKTFSLVGELDWAWNGSVIYPDALCFAYNPNRLTIRVGYCTSVTMFVNGQRFTIALCNETASINLSHIFRLFFTEPASQRSAEASIAIMATEDYDEYGLDEDHFLFQDNFYIINGSLSLGQRCDIYGSFHYNAERPYYYRKIKWFINLPQYLSVLRSSHKKLVASRYYNPKTGLTAYKTNGWTYRPKVGGVSFSTTDPTSSGGRSASARSAPTLNPDKVIDGVTPSERYDEYSQVVDDISTGRGGSIILAKDVIDQTKFDAVPIIFDGINNGFVINGDTTDDFLNIVGYRIGNVNTGDTEPFRPVDDNPCPGWPAVDPETPNWGDNGNGTGGDDGDNGGSGGDGSGDNGSNNETDTPSNNVDTIEPSDKNETFVVVYYQFLNKFFGYNTSSQTFYATWSATGNYAASTYYNKEGKGRKDVEFSFEDKVAKIYNDNYLHFVDFGCASPVGITDINISMAMSHMPKTARKAQFIVSRNSLSNVNADSYTPTFTDSIIDVDICTCTEGRYLRWIDSLGYSQYYLFDKGSTNDKIKRSTTSTYSVTAYNGTDFEGKYSVSSDNTRSIVCCACQLDEDLYSYVRTIANAAIVDLYLGKDNNGRELWEPVTIEDVTIKHDDKDILHDVEITIVRSEDNSQRL